MAANPKSWITGWATNLPCFSEKPGFCIISRCCNRKFNAVTIACRGFSFTFMLDWPVWISITELFLHNKILYNAGLSLQ